MLFKKVFYVILTVITFLSLSGCGDRVLNSVSIIDSDNDGLSDDLEIELGTNPNNPDSDNDGLSDDLEIELGTNPNSLDSDNDGLSDNDEVNTYGTDPLNPDTDGDGVNDGSDITNGTLTALKPCLPVQNSTYRDYNNSNSIWAEANCDDDSYSNGVEDNASRNPSYISDPYDAGDACFIFSDAKYCEVVADDNRTWIDRNLGADTACGATSEDECYGDLYQWGRFMDGHEKRANNTQDENPTTWPYTSAFHEVSDAGEFDWLNQTSAGLTPAYVPERQNFWDDNISGLCPRGWRVPTIDELDTMSNAEGINDKDDALNSNLHIPDAGSRSSGGSIEQTSVSGYLWSSTVNGNDSIAFAYRNADAARANANRSTGYSVRCIKAL